MKPTQGVTKVEVICPFCLESTKKWKMWNVGPVTSPITFYDGQTGKVVGIVPETTLNIKHEKDAVEWERGVLQKHLEVCEMRTQLTREVLNQYQLARIV